MHDLRMGSGPASTGPLLTVVGSINVDLTAGVERLPEPGETVLAEGFARAAGGKGANQAAAAAQLLGGRVALVGAVGDDADGRWIRRILEGAGVDAQRVATVGGVPTGMAMIAVDAAGENSIVVSPGANGQAFPAGAELPKSDGYLLSLEIPLPDVMRALDGMTGFVAVNASPARHLPERLIERADLFVVNETEFARLPELRGAAEVVETRGGDGVRIHRRGALVTESPASRVDRVVSTVGAGDAFCAALVAAMLTGRSTERAVRIATRVGAATVEQPNAQPRLHLLEHYDQDHS